MCFYRICDKDFKQHKKKYFATLSLFFIGDCPFPSLES